MSVRVLVAAALLAFATAAPADEPEMLAAFVPTPEEAVDEILRTAGVSSDDVVFDLGSGDGRIVIAAAERFGARGVGVEIDADLVESSAARAREAGVADRVRFVRKDILTLAEELQEATVVVLYLGLQGNDKLRAILERHLRPGTRVVSFEFDMPGWVFSRRLTLRDVEGRSRQIYLWEIGEHEDESDEVMLRKLGRHGCEQTLVEADITLGTEPAGELLAETLLARAQCLRGADRPAEALASVQSLLLLVPDSPRAPQAAYLAGLIHQSRRENALARATFRELIRRYPESKEARRARLRLE